MTTIGLGTRSLSPIRKPKNHRPLTVCQSWVISKRPEDSRAPITDHIQALGALGLARMRVPPPGPGGTIGRLRGKPRFIHKGQFDGSGLGLSDQIVDIAASLLESLRVSFFFKR